MNAKDSTHSGHCISGSLNDFPDDILCHILSFLTTELAVRSSVLSKRWRYLWTSIPTLDFKHFSYLYGQLNDSTRREHDNFMQFVDRALSLHNAPWIKKFALSYHVEVEDDESLIKKWISTVVSRDPQELDIHLGNERNAIPHCLFTCETLEVLQLYYLRLLLPSQIYLPNLKKLNLRCTILRDYDALNLLFASSALEELDLLNCTWEGDKLVGRLIISAPKLQRLSICDFAESYDGLASITISSPLTYFRYSGPCIKDYRLTCSSSLERATLHLNDFTNLYDIALDHFHKILRSLCFVKYLKLSAYAAEVLSDASIPMFKNLITLETADYPHIDSYAGFEMLLNKCPCLETLMLASGGIFLGCDYKDLSRPICLSSLKNITITFIKGNSCDLNGVHILLANAISLETMEVGLSKSMDEPERKKLEALLSSIPRVSTSCKLNLKLCPYDETFYVKCRIYQTVEE